MPAVPHIILGLHFGRMLGEVRALEMVARHASRMLVLVVLIFIAPVVAFFQGRKGARWVRLAPARFTGLRRALLAQWVAGIYLLIMTSLVGLLIAVVWIRVQMGAGR